jgi:peptidoglycan hydrolase-like protein with peptidoglycan-binding domain
LVSVRLSVVATTVEVAVQERASGWWKRKLGGVAAVGVLAAALAGACSSSNGSGGVSAAEARVSNAQKAVSDAQSALTKAHTTFCTDAKAYITAVDRYGKVFTDSKATVGDIKTAGADLENPRSTVTASAQAGVSARDSLAAANKELVDAQNALAEAQATASSVSVVTTVAPPTTTTLVPSGTVDRVKKAESDLTAAFAGVTDQTPLTQASAQVNSAAVALEMAWLQLFNQSGCLSTDQQQKAATAIHDYTVALQTDLKTAGYYTGEIDGVYGPETADAVKKLQSTSNLPSTGWVDRATAAALDASVVAKGQEAARQATIETAAVQSTLKLAGYWPGPVDGKWTPELTDALKKSQAALGVPATGEVDAATLAALEQAIASAQQAAAATTTTTAETSTTAGATTTPPTSSPA